MAKFFMRDGSIVLMISKEEMNFIKMAMQSWKISPSHIYLALPSHCIRSEGPRMNTAAVSVRLRLYNITQIKAGAP